MAGQKQVPQVRMTLQPNHQAVFDACVVAGPLYDIIKLANGKAKDRGLAELSFGEVLRILNSLRVLGLIAQTDNGTWFAPVTPKEREMADALNAQYVRDRDDQGADQS